MEPGRNPPCQAMDRPGPERPHRPGSSDCSTGAASEGGRGGAGPAEGNGAAPSSSFSSSSSLEGGSVNGDGERGGKRPRRRRQRERGGAWAGPRGEEPVWLERGAYDRAESAYQAWLAGGAVGGAPGGSPAPAPPRPPPPDCRHGDQVACHHLVEAVWVNKWAFESAERRFMEKATPPPATPSSLAISPSRGVRTGARRTPDEGYLSLTPTPTPPTPRQSINGLPAPPPELLASVWVEKPCYDLAEATYYQSLCRQLAPPATTPTATPSCSATAPGSGLGDGRGDAQVPQENQRRAQCVSAPAGGAVPAEGAGRDARLCFLHADSEGAWLEAPRFHAAERRFHERQAVATAEEEEVAALAEEEEEVAMMAGEEEEEAPMAAADAEDRSPALVAPSAGDWPAPSMPCSHTMAGVDFLAQERIWFDKFRYDEAECRFYERMNGPTHPPQETGANTILQDIARARENIQKSLAGMKTSLQPGKGRSRTPQNRRSQPGVPCGAGDQGELITRMKSLELENQSLHKVVEDLRSALSQLESRVALLEKRPAAAPTTAAPTCVKTCPVQQPKVCAPVEEEDDDEDDDLDLFGSDEEDDQEANRIREERLKAYAEKKAKKPALIAKSSILLDVKPWDDETDMVKLEECVRSVQADGLLWGSSKLVPVGYGIKKLQIQCVVEDDKVGTDLLEEEITKFEDHVQSVDVAAFNKI